MLLSSQRKESTVIVKTSYVFPPIPIRTCDWAAWVDGDEESGCWYGETEEEAVQALLEDASETA